MSGSASARIALVTASPSSLPVLMYSIDEGREGTEASTCPPSKAVSAGPLPPKGTWTRLMPAITGGVFDSAYCGRRPTGRSHRGEIAPGHLVIAQESLANGWCEAIVLDRKGHMLTLRFRDYPGLPKFFRHRTAVALMSPASAQA